MWKYQQRYSKNCLKNNHRCLIIKLMRSVIGVIALIVFLVVSLQLFHLLQQNFGLKRSLSDINREKSAIEKDSQNLKADLEYLASQDNLIKELKGKWNLKLPGEKMIVIVPNSPQ